MWQTRPDPEVIDGVRVINKGLVNRRVAEIILWRTK